MWIDQVAEREAATLQSIDVVKSRLFPPCDQLSMFHTMKRKAAPTLLLGADEGCSSQTVSGAPNICLPCMSMATLPLTSEQLASWTDEAIADAWKRSSWEAGDPIADALAAEMERRNLDF